jgi:hypothetical protein
VKARRVAVRQHRVITEGVDDALHESVLRRAPATPVVPAENSMHQVAGVVLVQRRESMAQVLLEGGERRRPRVVDRISEQLLGRVDLYRSNALLMGFATRRAGFVPPLVLRVAQRLRLCITATKRLSE